MRLKFRNEVELLDPLALALAFVQSDYSYRSYDSVEIKPDDVLLREDIRIANRIGARMSAAEIDSIWARREAIEAALRQIPPDLALSARDDQIPWSAIQDLYRALSGVKGVGLAKATKFLHKKRPLLIPMLDSVVAAYLESVDPIITSPPDERMLGLTRSYKTDLDANLSVILDVQRQLAEHGYHLTPCRILDLFTWAYAGTTDPMWASGLGGLVKRPGSMQHVLEEDIAKLEAEIGIDDIASDSTHRIIRAALAEVGYEVARREIGCWLRLEAP